MPTVVNSPSLQVKAMANHNFPTIEEFKSKFKHPLLANRYLVKFYGTNRNSFFSKMLANTTKVPNDYLECKVTTISLPNYQTDSEEIYVGGSEVSIPSGLTKGNLDMTIINQGIEYDLIYTWMNQVYNSNTRHYGYFDDVKINVYVVQFATNGQWVCEHHYYDCTPYNLQLDQLSYDEVSSVYTFTLVLNYFSYDCIYNNRVETDLASHELDVLRTNNTTTYNTIAHFEGNGTPGKDYENKT